MVFFCSTPTVPILICYSCLCLILYGFFFVYIHVRLIYNLVSRYHTLEHLHIVCCPRLRKIDLMLFLNINLGTCQQIIGFKGSHPSLILLLNPTSTLPWSLKSKQYNSSVTFFGCLC